MFVNVDSCYVVLMFLPLKLSCRSLSCKWHSNLNKNSRDPHPELDDVQERVVVARCGCQHFRFLSLDAVQILLQKKVIRTLVRFYEAKHCMILFSNCC